MNAFIPCRVSTVLTGKTQTYRKKGDCFDSAIAKTVITNPVEVSVLGLVGDEQADQRYHGGVDKAIHHYALEHYQLWQQEVTSPEGLTALSEPGAFGENISTMGITEVDICFGDQLQIGSCTVEVSQSRQPCWKLNQRFATEQMALRVQETGRTGWYYRVLKAGVIQAGDAISLLHRPYPEWSLARVNAVIFSEQINLAELEAFIQLPLTPSWQKMIEQRIHSGQVEDMHSRLYGR